MDFYLRTQPDIPAQGDVLSNLQSSRREPQFSRYHVRP
jgi:hypothetical protein